MYWSKPTKQALISSILTCHRFDEVLSILHFNNNEEEPTKADNNYDKLFKIRPLINHFNTKFQSAAIPEVICSADEQIVPYKGFSNLKRYNSSKPHSWGYKIYAREGKSSYLYQFEIEGDNQLITIDSNIGSAGNVVIRLTQNLHPNSFIAYDNYYATIRLIKFLNVKQYHVVSTMRTNRLHVPLLKPVKLLKREGRGSFDFLTTDDGHIVVTKWFDTKAVYILSNCFGPTPAAQQLVISLGGAQSESFGMNDFSRYDQIGHFPGWKNLNGTTKNFKSKR
ncbi:unnamed protein product [Adineta ricciae]|uniref:PiggyBac transposable element-derived protein domain-containing protein n=1 Tax=Adineta ricciae TaxID=249248 RepID=A0A814T874_ADIRI|nr:unnamed protein product [Adineta ricciae]CAF1411296.1 unnamed protein product [Adineta ricciae]